MSYSIVIKQSVAYFTIQRPAMRNAVNYDIMEGLESFLDQIQDDPEISFAVITGEGNAAFCSGGDLSDFHGFQTADDAWPMLSRGARILYRIATLPMPTIALVNGAAVGGGCELASACDYRLVASHAKVGFIQGTLAITSGWGGATLLFEKNAPHDQLLLLTSRASVHSAVELKEIGWVTEIFEGDAQNALAEFLAPMIKVHRNVHRAYKSIAMRKWDTNNLEQAMQDEARVCSILWESDAHHEAVQRFLTKTK
ncbi:enoyl-CoA hydratase/isomerase family protein [Sporosarcina sp. PTS2304]|uniref:enoyl-CoA hydratase/isomerase family protein n=1 Tax=Sporosarcina sp. PTS2304 TaxID=2283194 RepID=UPI000E0D29C8|nr:enoyl-CoA hydratase/isomerase family protein [Sporosarcina sp. PTS2304]AXH98612.1 enoyl-CoA hydratase/isomerase family protein [Sporosarcina sp. PTS2304]